MVGSAVLQGLSNSNLEKTNRERNHVGEATIVFGCYFALVFVVGPLIISILGAIPAHRMKY